MYFKECTSHSKKIIIMLENSEHLTGLEERMNKQGYIYRCPKKCPIGKNCFVIKVPERIEHPLTVLLKCIASKSDIEVTIGGSRPP